MEGIWASRFLALGERAPLVNFFDGSRTCLGALRRRTKQKGMMRGSHGLASAYCRQIIPPEALFQPQHNRARGLTNTNKAWGFLLSVPGLEGQDDASLPLSCPPPFLWYGEWRVIPAHVADKIREASEAHEREIEQQIAYLKERQARLYALTHHSMDAEFYSGGDWSVWRNGSLISLRLT